MAPSSQIVDRPRKRDALVGVIGLGYVGLPLSIEFWRAGLRVIGFDIDPDKASRLLAGESYITDVPDADVAQAAGRMRHADALPWTWLCDASIAPSVLRAMNRILP